MQVKKTTAVDVTVDRPHRKMTVIWGDEHQSTFAINYLRSICPCANCDTTKHGGEASLLRPEQFNDLEMKNVEEVGRYALRFTWSDGHDTGIYSYEYLRQNCPCGACGS